MFKDVLKFDSTAQWVRDDACRLAQNRGDATAEVVLSGKVNSGTLVIQAETQIALDSAVSRVLNNHFCRYHFKKEKVAT